MMDIEYESDMFGSSMGEAEPKSFRPFVNSSKFEALKKYPIVCRHVDFSTASSNPMLMAKGQFLYKLEQLYDAVIERVRRARVIEVADVGEVLVETLRAKAKGKPTVLAQNLLDFVYSANKFGDIPYVAFFLTTLMDGADKQRLLGFLFLRHQVCLASGISFRAPWASGRDPSTTKVPFGAVEKTLNAAYDFDQIAQASLLKKLNEKFAKTTSVPYLDLLAVLRECRLPYKEHAYLERIVALYRINVPTPTISRPRSVEHEHSTSAVSAKKQPVQLTQSLVTGDLSENNNPTPIKMGSSILKNSANSSKSPGVKRTNSRKKVRITDDSEDWSSKPHSPDFVQLPSDTHSKINISPEERRSHQILLAQCRTTATQRLQRFIEENSLTDDSFYQLNQICLTQIMHKYISLIKTVVKGEQDKFFRLLRIDPPIDKTNISPWSEACQLYKAFLESSTPQKEAADFMTLLSSQEEIQQKENFFLRFQYGLPPA